MKTPRLLTILLPLTAALSLSIAAAPPARKPAEPLFDANTIPQSVFIIPSTPGKVRDPFFPDRVIVAETTKPVAVTNTRPTGVTCLVLKGLSGAPSSPLAIINGRTMAPGEDAEINTECGRLLVHCVSISSNAAIVEVSGERRELHLRPDL